MEKGHEIWYMKCKQPMEVWIIYDSSQGIRKV